MSKARQSIPLPLVSMREAAESAHARFERMDAPVWDLRAYRLDRFPSVEALWPVKRSLPCRKKNCKKCDTCQEKTCEKREGTASSYVHKNLKTADALYIASDGNIYFIEFKAQPSRNVDDKDVNGKAFESLYAAVLNVLENRPMAQIRANAEFVVVFKETSTTTRDYYIEKSRFELKQIANKVRKHGDMLDKDGCPIYFGLEKFRKAGYYRDVHTFDATQFEQWAAEKLQPQQTPPHEP